MKNKVISIIVFMRYKGPSREKDRRLQEEIDLLWRKVRIYEKYGDEERRLREKAVDALRLYEEQLFGKVKDIAPLEFNEEEHQMQSNLWRRYRVKMIRTDVTNEDPKRDPALKLMRQRAERILESKRRQKSIIKKCEMIKTKTN